MDFSSHCASWVPVGRERQWLNCDCVAVVALTAPGNVALAVELCFGCRLFS